MTLIQDLKQRFDNEEIEESEKGKCLDTLARKLLGPKKGLIGMESQATIESAKVLFVQSGRKHQAQRLFDHPAYKSCLEFGNTDPSSLGDLIQRSYERRTGYFSQGERVVVFYNERWHPGTITDLQAHDAPITVRVDYRVSSGDFEQGRGVGIGYQNPGIQKLDEFKAKRKQG